MLDPDAFGLTIVQQYLAEMGHLNCALSQAGSLAVLRMLAAVRTSTLGTPACVQGRLAAVIHVMLVRQAACVSRAAVYSRQFDHLQDTTYKAACSAALTTLERETGSRYKASDDLQASQLMQLVWRHFESTAEQDGCNDELAGSSTTDRHTSPAVSSEAGQRAPAFGPSASTAPGEVGELQPPASTDAAAIEREALQRAATHPAAPKSSRAVVERLPANPTAMCSAGGGDVVLGLGAVHSALACSCRQRTAAGHALCTNWSARDDDAIKAFSPAC